MNANDKAIVPVIGGVVAAVDRQIHITDKLLMQTCANAFRVPQDGTIYVAVEWAKNGGIIEISTGNSQLDGLFNEAFRFQAKRVYGEAIAKYSESIEINPEFVEARYCRSIVYYYVGDKQNAISDLDAVIKIDSKNPDPFNKRGCVYYVLGEYSQAIDNFTKSIEIAPTYFKAYHNRGLAYSNMGDKWRAIEDFNKAIELDPNDADVYRQRGRSYSALFNYQQAIEDYDRSIEIFPYKHTSLADQNPAYSDRENTYAILRKLKKNTGVHETFGMILVRKRNGTWLIRWRRYVGDERSCHWAPAKDLEYVRKVIIEEAVKLDSIIQEALEIINGTSKTHVLEGDSVCARPVLDGGGVGCFTLYLRNIDNLNKTVQMLKSGKWDVKIWKVPMILSEMKPHHFSDEKVKSQYLIAVARDDSVIPSEVII